LTDGVDAPAETEADAAVAVSGQHLVPVHAPRGYQVRRSLLAALAIAVLVSVIVIERRTLARSLRVLTNLNVGWFLLAVAAEAISLTSFGLSRRRLVRVNGRQIGFGSVMMITYAANALSISVPFAGAELAMVFSYRQFRRHGVDAATTTGWTLAVSAIFSTSALAFLLAIGALTGSGSLASAAGAVVFIIPGAAVLLALRFEDVRALLHRVIARLVGFSRSIFGVPANGVDGLDGFLDRVASIRMPWLTYAEVFGLAVLNWAADCAALAFSIRAMGLPVPWDNLLLVYGAGAAVGSTGITPGGFALVELALTAALTATGLHRSPALAAVLAYRLVNFWLVLVAGWILMAILAHRRAGPGGSSPGAGGLRWPRRIRQPAWSRWPIWRPTRIRRWPGCGPPRRPAGCPLSAPGSSPGMTSPWRSCVMRGRSRSTTLVSPRPRWSGRACSRWTARSTRATGVRSTASSGATRSTRGSPRSRGPRPAAWCRSSSRAVRPSCAGPLAVAVMAEALGLGRADPVQVLAWYDGIVAAVQAEAATAEARAPAVGPAGTAAFAELAASLRGVIAAPGSASLLSEAAGPLTEAEVISNAAVMMFGGIETTEGMIANALLHLLSFPAQLELVLADRGLVPAAIEESLRLEPAAAVVDRYATTDARLGGAGVRAGDQVTVSIAGANRDPAVFGEPDAFDVRRPNAGRHLAFAHGPHFCLGAHLARLEAQVAIGILLGRLPRLRLDPRYPSAPRGLVFRKPPDLHVRWNWSTLRAQPCHRHAACGIAARSLAGSALFSQANRTTTSPRRSAVPLAGPVNATWPRTSSSPPQSPRLIRQRERAIRASHMTLMTVSSAPVRINLNRL